MKNKNEKNDIIVNELKAMFIYANRNTYNLLVLKTMAEQLIELINKQMPCEQTNENSTKMLCPHCYSSNIQSMYKTINLDGSNNRAHYICKDCHKEFEV